MSSSEWMRTVVKLPSAVALSSVTSAWHSMHASRAGLRKRNSSAAPYDIRLTSCSGDSGVNYESMLYQHSTIGTSEQRDTCPTRTPRALNSARTPATQTQGLGRESSIEKVTA